MVNNSPIVVKTSIFTFLTFILFPFGDFIYAQKQFDQLVETGGNDELKMVDDQGSYLDFKTGWYVGGSVGTTLLYGDVTTYNVFPKTKDFSKSFGSGISLLGGKKIKWGLSGEIQLSSGKTKGYKESIKNNPFYCNATYQSYSFSAKYNLSDFYLRNMGNRTNGKAANRLQTYISLGIGQVFFRSRLYYATDSRLKQTYGYKESAKGQITGQQLLEKDKALRALIIPMAFKFQYRLNFQTDLVFDFSYTTTFTDKLDAWDRNWTAKDRYMYVGVGLMRHFGRTADDELPKSLRYSYLPKEKKSNNKIDDIDLSDVKPPRKRLFGRKKKASSSTDDAELNLRLKLFETQLRLFEMQQMIDDKK